MKFVVRQTGLTAHAIRAWERRYGALSPARSKTNRRCYSEKDLQRLLLLAKATRAGHGIGEIARLPLEKLAGLVRLQESGVEPPGRPGTDRASEPGMLVEEVLAAARAMDGASLERIFNKAGVALSLPELLDQMIFPVMDRVGDLWRNGKMRIAEEHLVSGVIRNLLGGFLRFADAQDAAPMILVATPAGQLHEIGALMAAATAVSEGWKATYLGPNLPAQEIAMAAERTHAAAVALSIVYPPADPRIPVEMEKLRKYLRECPLIAGGRAAAGYRAALDAAQVLYVPGLPEFRNQLERLREFGGGAASRQKRAGFE
jgi:methanogenic corrinoid protein MtbC1